MNDTSLEIEEKMQEMIRAKSPEERAMMGWSMYLTSRLLVIDAIVKENPQILPADLRCELFLKFYGDDFSPQEKEKIIQHLQKV